ncbi:hypothetical protein BT63DRAFT_454520 [Microthyrium microscopicum]|uniref:Uncharacterized protein n=1 Tax=Microthyrium microscopicum TaxID=703497 RepID=A0A6A6UFW7_9PEZI|nr:hypothetical protein BT63DRAFT_454520 [Microthyrium microscopicum]
MSLPLTFDASSVQSPIQHNHPPTNRSPRMRLCSHSPPNLRIFQFACRLHAFLGPANSSGSCKESATLRTYVLPAFPNPLLERKKIHWELVKYFDDCLKEAGVAKPSNVEGAKEWADIWWFTKNLCQCDFLQPRVLEKVGVAERRDGVDEQVDRQLRVWGL